MNCELLSLSFGLYNPFSLKEKEIKDIEKELSVSLPRIPRFGRQCNFIA